MGGGGIRTTSYEIVWWLRWCFPPCDELFGIVTQQGHDVFIAIPVTAENTLCFERLQVEPVEKGTVAFGRCACANQVNPITVLDHGPLPASQNATDGRTGIAVTILIITTPHNPGRVPRFICVQHERSQPAAITFKVADENDPVALTPQQTDQALLGLHQFCRLSVKRGLQHHNTISIRYFLFWVSAVQRLNPNESRRFSRPPAHIKRDCYHTVDWDLIGHGYTGNFVTQVSFGVPHLYFLRKVRFRIE